MTAPAPLEWHPWYRGKTRLLDWLTSHDRVVHLPIVRAPQVGMWSEHASPAELDVTNRLTLQKHKACGPAPYVGDPFVYAWWFATDQYGRAIASDSQIEYLP